MSLPVPPSDPTLSPVLLALDTATDRIHAALSVGARVYTVDLPGGAQASAALLPALTGLLSQAGLGWSAVDAIAFGRGPGAFTGLRTACSVTQGLALGLDRPVLAIDTLMAVAEDARLADPTAWREGDVLWVLQDARMDELYVAAYAWQSTTPGQLAGWTQVQAPQVWPLTEPARRWASAPAASSEAPARLAGNALRAYPDRFTEALAAGAQVGLTAQGDAAQPRGEALASLAQQAWAVGQAMDAALALPLYVRDKVAQTTAERQAARA